MTRLLLLSALLALTPALWAQDYKELYFEGLEHFEEGRHQEALKNFKEAHRLEPKADMVRAEGAFFEPYLPAYRIALTLEKLDQIMEAAEWMERSKTAVEADVIRRKRDLTAQYNADVERITNAATALVAERKRAYDAALTEAETLLGENKFTLALEAYQKLAEMDPSRSEAQVGLKSVSMQKQNYLRGRALDLRTALTREQFERAETYLAQIRAVDPGFSELPILEREIADAKQRAEQAAQQAKLDEAKRKEAQAQAQSQPKQPKPRPQPTGPSPAELAKQRERAEAAQRAKVREMLVDALKPYRRGEPTTALKILEEGGVEGAERYGSFHWLRGLFLASEHARTIEGDPALLTEARSALRKAHELQPEFEPDPDIYPGFIIDLYASVKSE